MKRILYLAFLAFAVSLSGADKPYDFRASSVYSQLPAADRLRLEQVQRDFVLLWGALDMFADAHGRNPPERLDDLDPLYLTELPSDTFATPETANPREMDSYTRSKDGWGYRYRRSSPCNRGWVISSVGLPEFPYLAEQGNVGLYRCKGIWISGFQPCHRAHY
jgi:hypothetical protein